MVWGLLNLIIAAIVDSSIQAREEDNRLAAFVASQQKRRAWESFAQMCSAMDTDVNGDITVTEFLDFCQHNQELQRYLSIMGVSEKHVSGLLKLMDRDGSGTLDYMEFVEEFTHMRSHVVKTTVYYLHKYVEDIHEMVAAQKGTMDTMLKEMSSVRCELEKRSTLDMVERPPPRDATPLPKEVGSNFNAGVAQIAAASPCVDEHYVPKVGETLLGWYFYGPLLPKDVATHSQLSPFHATTRQAEVWTATQSCVESSRAAGMTPVKQQWEPLPATMAPPPRLTPLRPRNDADPCPSSTARSALVPSDLSTNGLGGTLANVSANVLELPVLLQLHPNSSSGCPISNL